MFAYLSGKKSNDEAVEVFESGALKISNAAWENTYRLSFKESEWSKPLLTFHPQELSAPRELLSRSTLGYYLMKLDTAAAWREWGAVLFDEEERKNIGAVWALDFEKEIIPEIGPECGLALLALPDFIASDWTLPWAIFFKLKSDKLATALGEGKLFKAAAGAQPARIKIGSSEIALAIKNGFLVFGSSESAISRLNLKEKLATTRDFSRAAKSASESDHAGIVAFGGYNIEAAIEDLKASSNDPAMSRGLEVITSLARAFHSQSFYATASAGSVRARISVSLDREGRYSVAELSSLSKDSDPTFAAVEARGVAIADQQRLSSLKLRIRAKAEEAVDRIKEDVTLNHQSVEKRSEKELIITVLPRRSVPAQKIRLPISGAEFADALKPTRAIRSDDKSVIEKAREIAGEDRDAWSVARKIADWTYKNLKWKRVDDADAAQTLATHEADCLEFSQLFVAMARSLGLPARTVYGLAYTDGSFGGHAWVEIYAGQWIELDPNWGDDFVDATHIKVASGELLNYAALNLVEIEVIEAPRSVPDFQRDAATLAEKLREELQIGDQSALAAALDIAALTDEQMGKGSWSTMSEREREQMTAAYRRAVIEIVIGIRTGNTETLRLVKVNQTGDRAEAIMIQSVFPQGLLLKFKLARKGDSWALLDVIYADMDFRVVSSTLQPTIRAILDRRSGKQPQDARLPAATRALFALNKDANSALDIVDKSLKDEPKDRTLRHLKAMALLRLEKRDDAIKLWMELAGEEPPFAIALFNLARLYSFSTEEADIKKAIAFCERYAAIEPDDTRTHELLAPLYERAGNVARAEIEYRKALQHDSLNSSTHIQLAMFLISQRRFGEATSILDEGSKQVEASLDLFSDLFFHLLLIKRAEDAEAVAAALPKRMEKSAGANVYLARMRLDAGRARESLPLLKKAIEIKSDYIDAHLTMAEAHRKLNNWSAALAAADAAIRINAEKAEAHYNRACALARLGRSTEAMASLRRALELEPYGIKYVEEEEDLKPLAELPEFKKLVADSKISDK